MGARETKRSKFGVEVILLGKGGLGGTHGRTRPPGCVDAGPPLSGPARSQGNSRIHQKPNRRTEKVCQITVHGLAALPACLL